MKRPLISIEKCQSCDECQLEVKCENGAIIREEPADMPWIDFYKCRGCMKCMAWCTFEAVEELVQPCHNMERKMGW